jgi:hypothetical protein
MAVTSTAMTMWKSHFQQNSVSDHEAAMLRRFHIDFRDAMRGHIFLCGLTVTLLCGSAPAGAQSLACAAPQQPMQQIELMFGRNIGDRVGVGEAAWSRFLAREITPRFPDGLTVLNAIGQWQSRDRGRLVREPSRLVVIVTVDDTPTHDKIAAIIATYKQRFRQRSVGVISHPVCAVF